MTSTHTVILLYLFVKQTKCFQISNYLTNTMYLHVFKTKTLKFRAVLFYVAFYINKNSLLDFEKVNIWFDNLSVMYMILFYVFYLKICIRL